MLSIINKNVYYCPLRENLSVPKCIGIGTTQFHKVAIFANGLHSIFDIILSFQKVSKHPNLYSLHKLPFPCYIYTH